MGLTLPVTLDSIPVSGTELESNAVIEFAAIQSPALQTTTAPRCSSDHMSVRQ